jgi:phosphotriesterase-related protein
MGQPSTSYFDFVPPEAGVESPDELRGRIWRVFFAKASHPRLNEWEGGIMVRENLVGKVQTVLGAIQAEELGVTSSHEHILSDMSTYFIEPQWASQKELADQPLCLDNLGWARAHRFSSRDNARLGDRDLAAKEVAFFRYAGGNSIAEMSQDGLSRDPEGLTYVSRASGVNIIMGSGYYVGISHPVDMDARTEDEITQEIVADILSGVGETGIKAGIIGEIGCTVLSANERKVLRAACVAQRLTGAPLVVHPSFSDELALEILDILREAGAVLDHTMICHMEVMDFALETRLKILEAGCYVGYDNFGNIGYPHGYLGMVVNLTTDLARIRDIKHLIERGYLRQILPGQDIVFKDMLRAYGGYGYAHLLENAVPLMRTLGLSEGDIHALLVDNPKAFFTFREASS